MAVRWFARNVPPCERLRDPSHTRTLTVDELIELLVVAGGSITASQTRPNPLQLADWMERTGTAAPARVEITTALERELDGGPGTGLRPHRRDGELWLSHEWAAITADDIRPSVGIALFRLVTPFGVGAVEYAIPARPRLGDDPRGRWHISFAARAQF